MNTSKIQSDKYLSDQSEYIRLRNALINVLTKIRSPELSVGVSKVTIGATVDSLYKTVCLIDNLPTSNSWSDIKIRNLEGCVDKLMCIKTDNPYLFSEDDFYSIEPSSR